MTINLLIDMNLSPDWVPFFARHGWTARHWSSVGAANASDRAIMDWARANEHVVFTHDLDFGTALALSHDAGPSVVQIRSQDVLPDAIGRLVVAALQRHAPALAAGALVVIDQAKMRVRILPL